MASLDIKYIKGIGEQRAKLFHKLGIHSACALLRYYPRDYRDYSDIREIYSAEKDRMVTVKARLLSLPKEHFVRANMVLYKFPVTDQSAVLEITLYNNKHLANSLKLDCDYIFYGKISGNIGPNRTMSSPEVLPASRAVITPVYPTTAGLYQGNIRKSVLDAMEKAMPRDPLPQSILERYDLCDLNFAIRNIHFPKNEESMLAARKRLVFEELMLFRTGILMFRTKNRAAAGTVVPQFYFGDFCKLLPFELTDSQKKAIFECMDDMKSGRQMNRLLEGDVGSGKTAVAAALMHSLALCGVQSAMMAPTEILAEQHYKTLSKLLNNAPVKIALLTGSKKAREKTEIKKQLQAGEIDILIGTQALIQKDVEFCNLGLVVTDEQHRFGVAQRARLANKGRHPHILVMSATPIPRTLGLILYGDLDLSIMDTLPSGRKPINTYCVSSKLHERIYNYIKRHLDDGEQAYIVCPLVEEGEETGVELSATAYYEELKGGAFAGYPIGLLHGKQKPNQKEEVMRKFSNGEIKVLVATTVIEVGVDVPQATVILIENAERFGLSQLHQLRGRVGRGQLQSDCILVSDTKNEETKKRLQTLCKTGDGFKIAEEDLKMRGPGDFIGNRQHGLPLFKLADLSADMETLQKAGEAAEVVLSDDPKLSKPQHADLKAELAEMFRQAEHALS